MIRDTLSVVAVVLGFYAVVTLAPALALDAMGPFDWETAIQMVRP